MSPPLKRSAERDARFFTALENAHAVLFACRAAGYTVPSVYRWRNEDADFAGRWRDALIMAGDLLEEEADRRGRDGYDEPVFHKGKEVGRKRRYSERLLLARLKAVRPERYIERLASAEPPRLAPIVNIRDFPLEHHVVRFLKEGKVTLEDLEPWLRPRVAKLLAEPEGL